MADTIARTALRLVLFTTVAYSLSRRDLACDGAGGRICTAAGRAEGGASQSVTSYGWSFGAMGVPAPGM